MASVVAAEAVGAEDGVAHRHEGADLVGEAAHVIGGGDGRAGAPFEALGDVGFARFGFRVQAKEIMVRVDFYRSSG